MKNYILDLMISIVLYVRVCEPVLHKPITVRAGRQFYKKKDDSSSGLSKL